MPMKAVGPMALLLISAAALGTSSVAARASIIQYTYTGQVGYGYDRAGLFGNAETLTGERFTLVERFNTDRSAFRYVDAAQSLQFGGQQRGAPGAASLTVTIGGVSRSIADLEDYIYSGSVTGKHLDFVKNATGYEYGGFYVESPLMRADYGSATTLNADQARFIGNYQYFNAADASLATYASFDVGRLTVGLVSAVPLPGSLALFGGALLILGFGMRYRRTAIRLEKPKP
ncbi:hypothetical protein P7D22_00080 [Lichenihabitans sp. Uapishka_5]|uniref:hypothetical protein n=1 Tax=Lichenihabitans sp. Uapishka_5 TaxID=3037302 RepID=UPI0029E7ECDF|nr:hypothetical protein [Lichenihabitans sp. Uapishka_5]MDX7949576.1 hypothetical protein [Lichenihabitans sp. Uapishka_5]